MKRILAFVLAICLMAVPASAYEVEEDTGLRMAAICDNEHIEVGDQFLVRVMLDGDFDRYLTYIITGSFDPEMAELIAPVYKDDGFRVLYNSFSNEDGLFQFDAADIANMEGSDDPLILSLLFVAKKAGSFSVELGSAPGSIIRLFLGRTKVVDGKQDYDFTVDGFETEIYDDSDKDEVVIISERKNKTPFDDMYGHEWAEVAVGALSRFGILDGIAEPGGSYEPDKSITRGEFVAMLVRGAEFTGSTDNFPDVPEDYPYAKEIMAAKRVGVALGDENGNFNPDSTVTRQDISAFVYRALNYLHKIQKADETYLADFYDTDDISDYAFDTMCAVVRARLIKGDDQGRLSPLKDMTRAEAAVLIESVMIHIKLVR
ncbi:MAG: S-layer homology domain-containing protein [Oscillospiraceae bacterium]|nr:S-layer homology domain-containing protein [Oscillospiraceae bacterium]